MKKMLLGLVAVAMLLSLFAPLAHARNPDVTPQGMTLTFTFTGEGQFKNYVQTLSSLADRDKYVMTLTMKLRITVIIADCCLMGDTIGVFYPTSTTPVASAVSPNIIMATTVASAGTINFWVGYIACPGGFPASYYIWIIATHA